MLQYYRTDKLIIQTATERGARESVTYPLTAIRSITETDRGVTLRFVESESANVHCDGSTVTLHEGWLIAMPPQTELWRYGAKPSSIPNRPPKDDAPAFWTRHPVQALILERQHRTNAWRLASVVGLGVPPADTDGDCNAFSILVDLAGRRAMLIDDYDPHTGWSSSLRDVLEHDLGLDRQYWPEWFGQPATNVTPDAATGTAG